jgi:hypothetical protein
MMDHSMKIYSNLLYCNLVILRTCEGTCEAVSAENVALSPGFLSSQSVGKERQLGKFFITGNNFYQRIAECI